jgi:hypothetical protein
MKLNFKFISILLLSVLLYNFFFNHVLRLHGNDVGMHVSLAELDGVGEHISHGHGDGVMEPFTFAFVFNRHFLRVFWLNLLHESCNHVASLFVPLFRKQLVEHLHAGVDTLLLVFNLRVELYDLFHKFDHREFFDGKCLRIKVLGVNSFSLLFHVIVNIQFSVVFLLNDIIILELSRNI